MNDAKVTISRATLQAALDALDYCYSVIENMEDGEATMICQSVASLQAALAAQLAEPPKPVADALDRMDALLDPKAGLLTVGYDSATARASRWDMQIIRAALAAQPADPSMDTTLRNAAHRRIDHATPR